MKWLTNIGKANKRMLVESAKEILEECVNSTDIIKDVYKLTAGMQQLFILYKSMPKLYLYCKYDLESELVWFMERCIPYPDLRIESLSSMSFNEAEQLDDTAFPLDTRLQPLNLKCTEGDYEITNENWGAVKLFGVEYHSPKIAIEHELHSTAKRWYIEACVFYDKIV